MHRYYIKQNHRTRKMWWQDDFYFSSTPPECGNYRQDPPAAGAGADGSSYHGRIRTPFRSRPLNNISSASARSAIFAAPSGTFGHEKFPASSFFVMSQRPVPSQYSSRIRSLRLLVKTKI
jgi:hypothetical protein